MEANARVFFFKSIVTDARIGPGHVSLYAALYYMWEQSGGCQPLFIKRCEVMQLAKISSSATYHKVIRQLMEYGYINYFPCFNPAKKSEVYFLAKEVNAKRTLAFQNVTNKLQGWQRE